MEKVPVFISWSGDRSKHVAEALRNWLPKVFQCLDGWISTTDLDKGTKWQEVLTGKLATCKFAIICLTPENLNEPWLVFEAGALSKDADSRTFTYLYRVEHSEVKPPLSQFNHTLATEGETFKLVESLNKSLGDFKLSSDVLRDTFEVFWPKLSAFLDAIPEQAEPEAKRTERDILDEILASVREQGSMMRASLSESDPLTIALTRRYSDLVKKAVLSRGSGKSVSIGEMMSVIPDAVELPTWKEKVRNRMATFKRGGIWWYKFNWNGKTIRESTKIGNKRVAQNIESARKPELAKGEVGRKDRVPAPTVADFAKNDFLPFVRSTSAEKPRTVAFY